MSTLRAWSALSLFLGIAVVAAALRLGADPELPDHEQPAIRIALVEAGLLAALATFTLIAARRLIDRFTPRVVDRGVHRRRPYTTLFLISFVALFIEMMLIRYCNSQIRIFSFYKNVPLIGCFVGLGLGCCLSRGNSRHILLFLAWLIPVGVFLSAGSIVVRNALGEFAAIGTTEHVLGDVAPQLEPAGMQVFSQVLMAGFCVATLVVITLLFELLGRVLGQAFEQVSRLRGYTVNIVGSLVGILAFTGLAYVETPPWVWFSIGLLPLLWWAPRRSWLPALMILIAANVAVVVPGYGDTVWSRYQKLVGHEIESSPSGEPEAYLVQISDVFYQVAVDLRPETNAARGHNPFPHYDAVYADLPEPGRVLIVGAGTGNDIAAALRAGATRVDAVDIDPAIVAMGRRHHPERPYDDPRVHAIIDDARHAIRTAAAESYDLIVFGLLDSHTQLGTSSVRLDNYVFTMESLAEAQRLVRPGGHIALTAAVFQPWLMERFRHMLHDTTGAEVEVSKHGLWYTFLAEVGDEPSAEGAAATAGADLPTDDWPFIYLPEKRIPLAYLWVVGCLVLASVVLLRRRGLRLGAFTRQHAHLFFLGAAFLLMEVHAINRLALLFGTVWLVSAVTIAIVLVLIVAANLTVLAVGRIPYGLAYTALAASLAASYVVDPSMIVGRGTPAALGFGMILLSPVYFAGLVFARSFGAAPLAAPAIGANILGAVLGGWVEYGTMAFGMRHLVLVAAGFYLASLVLLLRRSARPQRDANAPEHDMEQGTPGAPSSEQPEPAVVHSQAARLAQHSGLLGGTTVP